MSLKVGLASTYILGGLIGCNGFLLPTTVNEEKKNLPVLVIGGGSD